jgi:Leucine-rich repeat (LRR) protein
LEQDLENVDRLYPQHEDEDEDEDHEIVADHFVVEAMATAVTDDDDRDFYPHFTVVDAPTVTGTPLPSTIKMLWEDKKARRFLKVLLFLLVILGVSLIVAGVRFNAFRRSSTVGMDTDSPTLSPSASPTVDASDLKIELLQYTSIEDLEEVGSPQQKALLWLANKDGTGIEFTDELFVERYAVVVFFYAVNGNTWLTRSDFLNPFTHVCDWLPAVTCRKDIGNPRRRVIGLNLDRNGLTGNLPSEIGLLRELTMLSLTGNSITGSIPPEITKLSMLSSLSMGYNELEGSLPDTMGNLTRLANFDLCDNHLTGSIPESVYNLKLLTNVKLCYNDFNGSLSESVATQRSISTLIH